MRVGVDTLGNLAPGAEAHCPPACLELPRLGLGGSSSGKRPGLGGWTRI
jgi:hypothetical protein